MKTNYVINEDPPSTLDFIPAHVQLDLDAIGDVNILVNDETVAFFNVNGELWLVNFPSEEIGELQRAGIRFQRAINANGEEVHNYFTIKTV